MPRAHPTSWPSTRCTTTGWPTWPRVRCLCDFAVKVTREPSGITAADLDVLRGEGWSDAAIHDALQVVSYFNYINRIADAVGIGDEPEWAPH